MMLVRKIFTKIHSGCCCCRQDKLSGQMLGGRLCVRVFCPDLRTLTLPKSHFLSRCLTLLPPPAALVGHFAKTS